MLVKMVDAIETEITITAAAIPRITMAGSTVRARLGVVATKYNDTTMVYKVLSIVEGEKLLK